MAAIRTYIAGVQAHRGLLGVVIAALLGGFGVLGHAPFHIWPAFTLSICGLFLLLEGAAGRTKPIRAGFTVAWSWAFGYFLAGMFWVGNAFLVDAEKFALLMPFAVAALPAVLAVCWGLGGALAISLWRADASRLLVFAVAIGLAEFVRGHVFTGLPWNLPAYIWIPGGTISQFSALTGPYGLSAMTVFVLASPAVFMTGQPKALPKLTAICVASLIALVSLYGVLRLGQAGKIDPMRGEGPIIAAGQAGYTQKEVWDPANSRRVTETYLDLLSDPAAVKADIVVWPEGAFPFLLLEQPEVLAAVQDRLKTRTLALGSVRRSQTSAADVYNNSILVFNNQSGALTLRGVYDKFHLVPFGEYLPFRPIFKALGIASLVAYDGEMTPGIAPSTLVVAGAPLADPRVCYEIVFPNFNAKASGKAGWILNVSVDAWYGDLLGPDQHYAQARARAIETGMPLVRAASGGWSAVVDRYGRPLAQHRSGAGYALARLPLDASPTPYGRFGERPFLFLSGLLFIIIVIARKKS